MKILIYIILTVTNVLAVSMLVSKMDFFIDFLPDSFFSYLGLFLSSLREYLTHFGITIYENIHETFFSSSTNIEKNLPADDSAVSSQNDEKNTKSSRMTLPSEPLPLKDNNNNASIVYNVFNGGQTPSNLWSFLGKAAIVSICTAGAISIIYICCTAGIDWNGVIKSWQEYMVRSSDTSVKNAENIAHLHKGLSALTKMVIEDKAFRAAKDSVVPPMPPELSSKDALPKFNLKDIEY